MYHHFTVTSLNIALLMQKRFLQLLIKQLIKNDGWTKLVDKLYIANIMKWYMKIKQLHNWLVW